MNLKHYLYNIALTKKKEKNITKHWFSNLKWSEEKYKLFTANVYCETLFGKISTVKYQFPVSIF